MPCHWPFQVHLSRHLSVFPVWCWCHDSHVFCISGSRQKENFPLGQAFLLAEGERRGDWWKHVRLFESPPRSCFHSLANASRLAKPDSGLGKSAGSRVALVVLRACDPPTGRGWWITEDSNTIYHKKETGILRNWEFAVLRLNRIAL